MKKHNQRRIYLSPPHMSGAERRYVEQAFDSNYIAPLGPMVDKFEEEICKYTGVGHCAALSSGTGALHLALLILGVKPGDEVICSSFTFAASVNPIVYVGATPVLVDSERDTWNLDPELLDESIKDRINATGRPPSAIILVHLYGMPARIDEIMTVAKEHGIPVIEDAAEALGSKYQESGVRSQESGKDLRGRHVGTFGCMSVLSFNGNKMITTSGGGALIANNQAYIERARFLATQARDDAPHYEHSEIGYNYRMSNIVAAVGVGQMEALPRHVKRCREIRSLYGQELGNLPGIEILTEPDERFHSNFWLTTITIDPACAHTDRETVRLALEEENIESRPLWKPMHLQPVFRRMNVPVYGGQVCESLFRDGLCLPSGVGMTDANVRRVCSLIRRCFDTQMH